MKQREKEVLQLAVGPKQFSPNLPVPKIQQLPSEPPRDTDTYTEIAIKNKTR